MTGLFTDSEEETEESDVEETVTVLDEKDIDSAKEFFPGLYVPTYIPDGYEFEKLEIQKYYSGDSQCDYVYCKGKDKLNLLLYYTVDSERSHQWQEDGQLIELQDRKIFVSEDSVSNASWVSVYTEMCTMDISGGVKQDDLITIAKGMKQ